VLQKRVEEASAPSMVFQEADLSSASCATSSRPTSSARWSTTRSSITAGLVLLAHRARARRPRRALQDSTPLFEAYGVADVISGPRLAARRPAVGGYLMIDYAEALTVIDVNSGSFVGRGKQARLEDTITRTNLEAAEAVVNELPCATSAASSSSTSSTWRARGTATRAQDLRKTLDEDRTKTFTAEISKLGLVEMTRQNVTEACARS